MCVCVATCAVQVGSVVGDWVDNAMTPRDGKGTALSSADIEEDIRRMTDNSVREMYTSAHMKYVVWVRW